MEIERSSMVSARYPIPAITLGAHVENRVGSCLSPTHRKVKAKSRVWPELITPLRSSLSAINVSPSSIMSVGIHFSIALNIAAAVMFAATRGLQTNRLNTDSKVDFPHLFSGELTLRIGEIVAASMQ